MKRAMRAYLALRSTLRPFRAQLRDLQGAALGLLIDNRWRAPLEQRSHGLPGELIVSLTSYPPRFPTLIHTLRCLLTQSVRPDRVVLWIAASDEAELPAEVTELRRRGLQVRTCPDLGPYKKIVPALREWPHAFIATAEDDVYYPKDWLLELVRACNSRRRFIPCHRAHRIALTPDGQPRPYATWQRPAPPGDASTLVFPTGVGGVLYPPGCLHADVTRDAIFLNLSPTSDDAWLYWMAQRNGWRFKRISGRQFVCWPGSQHIALQDRNVAGDNDRQIARLCNRFGFVGERQANASPSRHEEATQW